MIADFLKDFYVGQILMHLLFGAALTSSLYYVLAIRGKAEALPIARKIFHSLTIGIVLALCLNMMNVMIDPSIYHPSIIHPPSIVHPIDG